MKREHYYVSESMSSTSSISEYKSSSITAEMVEKPARSVAYALQYLVAAFRLAKVGQSGSGECESKERLHRSEKSDVPTFSLLELFSTGLWILNCTHDAEKVAR